MKHLIILILIIIQSSICYSSDSVYVTTPPIKFKQDSLRLNEAHNIISKFKNKVDIHNTPSLLPRLPMSAIVADLEYMLLNPNSTRLNDVGYYCGVVVVLNWLLNKRPDLYTDAVLNLSYNGKYEAANANRKLVIPKILKRNKNYSLNDSVKQSLPEMLKYTSTTDFILGVTLVHSEKFIQRIPLIYKDATYATKTYRNFFFANTMPWEIDDFFRALGIKPAKHKYYLGCRNNLKTLERIEKSVNQGKLPIIFENHYITNTKTKNLFYRTFGAHYVTIHEFKINKKHNNISISYWDYGKVSNTREIHPSMLPNQAKNLSDAIKRNKKYQKFAKNGKIKKIHIKTFLKGLKGYWIVE